MYLWEKRKPIVALLGFLMENCKFIFLASPGALSIISASKGTLSLCTAPLMFSCILMVLQLLTTGRFHEGGIKWTILINGSFECGSRARGTQQRVTKYGKINKCCTDAHSWLLGFQLIKWSFCKPIDRYSCRFSIESASVEAAYSELMRKVLIKLAICSIAFINGKIASFCCWYYHCCHLLLRWVSLKQLLFQQSLL